ncbi:MAG: hypothetical protein KJ879_00095 [Nanoarchaeota archaeon]|nr:hypothetical protein [Nanoarchaeota archaeon]
MKLGKYVLVGAVSSVLLLLAFSIDNVLWISASPEWSNQFTVYSDLGVWTGPVDSYGIKDFLDYAFGYRLYTVWTNWRDLLVSFLMGFSAVIGYAVYSFYESEVNKKTL